MLMDVIKRVAEVQNKLAEFGFNHIKIECQVGTLKPGVAGVAHLRDQKITISRHYLAEHREETLMQTVAHEVCHHYVNRYYPYAKQHHGPEFRRLMSALGLAGDTRHQMKLVNGPTKRIKTVRRWVYRNVSGLECKLTSQQHKKAQLGAEFRYKGERIVWTGKIVTVN